MKIKTKKEMNLPQLIEWAMENNIKDTIFLTKTYSVGFDIHGFIYFNSSTTIPLDTVFTVEIEEEITEDTKLWNFIELSSEGLLGRTYLHKNLAIEDVKTDNSVAFYIIDDDLTPTLIWKRGELVE